MRSNGEDQEHHQDKQDALLAVHALTHARRAPRRSANRPDARFVDLRSRVARVLRLRVAPEIQFKEDDTIARAARIESLLADVKKQDAAASDGIDDD